METAYAYDQQYTRLDCGDILHADPVDFGPIILSPGTKLTYFGDGRDHRSFEMQDGYALEYIGYLDLGYNSKLLLFDVCNFEPFRKHEWYYSFYYWDRNRLFIVRDWRGGSRDIYPKKVITVDSVEEISFVEQMDMFG